MGELFKDARVRAVLTFVAFLVAVAALALVVCGCDRTEDGKRMPAPLDCAVYDVPEYMDGVRDIRQVIDTRTGQRWWLLRLNGGSNEYVVLPVDGTVSEG